MKGKCKMTETQKKLKDNLVKLRKDANATISETAEGIGISLSYYSSLENPQSEKLPSLQMLERIAAYYKITADKLLCKK